jgi:predicted PolB exonuclease-like 3'-5' exonuclease
LLRIIKKKIADRKVLWLIIKILSNSANSRSKGMPLGNLTSQFFANVYLNELDGFVKSDLKAKYYIRYVDDFVILETDEDKLEFYHKAINEFLKENLKIEIHPDKSKIILLGNSLNFLGFRIFFYHKLLKKSNIRKMKTSFNLLKEKYVRREIDYDKIYDYFEGWIAYAKNANTYKMRKKITKQVEEAFPTEISSNEFNRYYKFLPNYTERTQFI